MTTGFIIKNGAEEISITIDFGNITDIQNKLTMDRKLRLFNSSNPKYVQKTATDGVLKSVIEGKDDIINKYTSFGYSEENLSNLATRIY